MYTRVAGTGRRIAPILFGSIAVVICLGCAGAGDLTAPDQVVIKKGPTAHLLYCDSLTVVAATGVDTVSINTDFDIVYDVTNKSPNETCNNIASAYVASGSNVSVRSPSASPASFSILLTDVIPITGRYHAGSMTGNAVVQLNAAGFIVTGKWGGKRVTVVSP